MQLRFLDQLNCINFVNQNHIVRNNAVTCKNWKPVAQNLGLCCYLELHKYITFTTDAFFLQAM